MYALYVEECELDNKPRVKESIYRNIFSTQFILDFHKPKSDRCATCGKIRVSGREGLITERESVFYQNHILEYTKVQEGKKSENLP